MVTKGETPPGPGLCLRVPLLASEVTSHVTRRACPESQLAMAPALLLLPHYITVLVVFSRPLYPADQTQASVLGRI